MGSDGAVFDTEMEQHVRIAEHEGVRLPIVSPEDLLTLKLAAFREDTARQWYDCLALLENVELDWDYLVRRATRRPYRVLSLLVYAAGQVLPVEWSVVERLVEAGRPS